MTQIPAARRSAPAWRAFVEQQPPKSEEALAGLLWAYWDQPDASDDQRAEAFASAWRSGDTARHIVDCWTLDGTCERLAAVGHHSFGPHRPEELSDPRNYSMVGRILLGIWRQDFPQRRWSSPVTAYRGSSGEPWDGLAWTTSRPRAENYARRAAQRTGSGMVWRATVEPEVVLLTLGDPPDWSSPIPTEVLLDVRADFEATGTAI